MNDTLIDYKSLRNELQSINEFDTLIEILNSGLKEAWRLGKKELVFDFTEYFNKGYKKELADTLREAGYSFRFSEFENGIKKVLIIDLTVS